MHSGCPAKAQLESKNQIEKVQLIMDKIVLVTNTATHPQQLTFQRYILENVLYVFGCPKDNDLLYDVLHQVPFL